MASGNRKALHTIIHGFHFAPTEKVLFPKRGNCFRGICVSISVNSVLWYEDFGFSGNTLVQWEHSSPLFNWDFRASIRWGESHDAERRLVLKSCNAVRSYWSFVHDSIDWVRFVFLQIIVMVCRHHVWKKKKRSLKSFVANQRIKLQLMQTTVHSKKYEGQGLVLKTYRNIPRLCFCSFLWKSI
jgi:hypothetical protein